jgi:hypothetical protein
MIYKNESDVPKHFLDDVPVIIPVFNQFYYLKNTINQLQKFGLKNYLILDNGSSYPPLLDWYVDTELPVLKYPGNPGPRDFYNNIKIWDILPKYFVVTDPDLQYNESMPENFIQEMIRLIEDYGIGKIGLALDISEGEKMYPPVKTWEGNYWNKIIGYTKFGDSIYQAATDTTFAMYKKRMHLSPHDDQFFWAPRIAGRFTAKHWGWYYEQPTPKEELDFYNRTATKWYSTRDALKSAGIMG